eukprot:218505_1
MGNSPSSFIPHKLNEQEWMNKIEQSRKNRFNADDDFELLIQYLADPQTIANNVISNIARVIRQYITNTKGITLCDFSKLDIKFDGIKVSMAIHPLNGEIYIADEYKIFKLTKQNTVQLIASQQIDYNILTHRSRITDLSFHSDGNVLFCMLNNDLTAVYLVDYNNENKLIHKRIIFEIHNKMNIFKYDFNHYYVAEKLINKLFPNIDTPGVKMKVLCDARIWPYATLYVPNFYKQELWLLQNNGIKSSPILYRIAMNKSRNHLETVKLYQDVDNFWDIKDSKEKNIVENKYVIAFDVDKYHGAVYIVTNNKVLYRLEKVNKNENNCKWKTTHKLFLKDVLKDIPVGIHTIRYDSIIGRVIFADNYKVQAKHFAQSSSANFVGRNRF